MTGLVVFLLLVLIVMQSKLLQELLGLMVLAFVAAVAYGYYLGVPTPPAELPALPVAIEPAPVTEVPKDPPKLPATSPGTGLDYRPARPYRQQ